MSQFISAEKETWVIQRYNKYIRAHMKKMLEYNKYLLKDIDSEDDNKTALLELLKNMSAEERAALMAEASK